MVVYQPVQIPYLFVANPRMLIYRILCNFLQMFEQLRLQVEFLRYVQKPNTSILFPIKLLSILKTLLR